MGADQAGRVHQIGLLMYIPSVGPRPQIAIIASVIDSDIASQLLFSIAGIAIGGAESGWCTPKRRKGVHARLGLQFVRRLWLNFHHLAGLDRLLQLRSGYPGPFKRYLHLHRYTLRLRQLEGTHCS
jgi:hypothetical protein